MKKLFGHLLLCLVAAGMLAGQADAGQKQKKSSKVPEFKEIPFPVTDADKRRIIASQEVTVDGKTYKIDYNTILPSGDKAGKGTFGLLAQQRTYRTIVADQNFIDGRNIYAVPVANIHKEVEQPTSMT